MRAKWLPIKITKVIENAGKVMFQATTEASKDDITRYSTEEGLLGELKLDDGRDITSLQRKKLYATFADISAYTGDVPEYTKEYFKFMYCAEIGVEYFSLSDCSLELAKEFINYVIEFVLINDIPLSESALNRTEDIAKYLYYCIKHKKCCVCGQPGAVYTLNEKKDKMCMCNNHHEQAKEKGLHSFCEAWKVFGIQFVG